MQSDPGTKSNGRCSCCASLCDSNNNERKDEQSTRVVEVKELARSLLPTPPMLSLIPSTSQPSSPALSQRSANVHDLQQPNLSTTTSDSEQKTKTDVSITLKSQLHSSISPSSISTNGSEIAENDDKKSIASKIVTTNSQPSISQLSMSAASSSAFLVLSPPKTSLAQDQQGLLHVPQGCCAILNPKYRLFNGLIGTNMNPCRPFALVARKKNCEHDKFLFFSHTDTCMKISEEKIGLARHLSSIPADYEQRTIYFDYESKQDDEYKQIKNLYPNATIKKEAFLDCKITLDPVADGDSDLLQSTFAENTTAMLEKEPKFPKSLQSLIAVLPRQNLELLGQHFGIYRPAICIFDGKNFLSMNKLIIEYCWVPANLIVRYYQASKEDIDKVKLNDYLQDIYRGKKEEDYASSCRCSCTCTFFSSPDKKNDAEETIDLLDFLRFKKTILMQYIQQYLTSSPTPEAIQVALKEIDIEISEHEKSNSWGCVIC